MLTIDGSFGEGGGQILRTALSLSLVTGREFRIETIRAGRPKPGLQPQHLAAVHAAAAIGRAELDGAALGSQTLVFQPRGVVPGDYAFAIGTAGSVTLVLQTVLPALLTTPGPSALLLEGGTHNPLAPPFEFIAATFLPVINRMGPLVRAKLDRHGFYPVGGGKIRVTVRPSVKLAPLDLLDRGALLGVRATAVVANLPRHVAEREIKILKRELALDPHHLQVDEVKSRGPGNVVRVELEHEHITESFTAFGEQGVRAEIVAGRLAKEVRRYLDGEAPVGEHLADQILLPLALAGGGRFVTFPLSPHALSNIEILKQFLEVEVRITPAADDAVRVEIGHGGARPPSAL